MKVALATSVIYAIAACAAKATMKPRPKQPSKLLALHNSILCVLSLIMCVGLITHSYARIQNEGLAWLWCETGGSNVWLDVYYYSKYYELLDTALAFACRSGPAQFKLHVWHHSYVLVMAYGYTQQQTLATIGAMFNTFVHIWMYYYYARTALLYTVQWKVWITRLQILQFVASLLFVAKAVYETPDLLITDKCKGIPMLRLNILFNITLLIMFIQLLVPKKKLKR